MKKILWQDQTHYIETFQCWLDCLKLDFLNQLKIRKNTDRVNRFLVIASEARAIGDGVPEAVDRHILCDNDTPAAFAHTWLVPWALGLSEN